MVDIVVNGRYRHFKGKEYKVLAVARHCDTLEELVVYQALYDSEEFGKDAIWIRPKKQFLETIERDGNEFERFTLIE